MRVVAPSGLAAVLLGVLLVAGCGRAASESPASSGIAASLRPLTREEAIAAARPFSGAPPSAVVVSAEAGPFGQFEPNRNDKVSLPPADQWVWNVKFADSGEINSVVIIDYVTGSVVETIKGITN